MPIFKEHRLSSETKICSASQYFNRILWNTKTHYPVQYSPSLAPVLRQMTPIHVLLSYLFKVNFQTAIPFTPRCSSYSFLLDAFPFSPLNPIFSGLLMKLFSAQYNCLLPPDSSSPLLSSILQSTLPSHHSVWAYILSSN
jgi:hypothetical protein